jgi:hypothetical protein
VRAELAVGETDVGADREGAPHRARLHPRRRIVVNANRAEIGAKRGSKKARVARSSGRPIPLPKPSIPAGRPPPSASALRRTLSSR